MPDKSNGCGHESVAPILSVSHIISQWVCVQYEAAVQEPAAQYEKPALKSTIKQIRDR